jgi:hypothetical protein
MQHRWHRLALDLAFAGAATVGVAQLDRPVLQMGGLGILAVCMLFLGGEWLGWWERWQRGGELVLTLAQSAAPAWVQTLQWVVVGSSLAVIVDWLWIGSLLAAVAPVYLAMALVFNFWLRLRLRPTEFREWGVQTGNRLHLWRDVERIQWAPGRMLLWARVERAGWRRLSVPVLREEQPMVKAALRHLAGAAESV